MIIMFGPAGAGKSMQGQLLAARFGWRWLSAGQLLRDTHDPAVHAEMQQGKLVSHESVVRVMEQALSKGTDVSKLILDGFPRQLPQAQWLVDSQAAHGQTVSLVVVLDVPQEELLKRLSIRGRADDTPEAVAERLALYENEIKPVLEYFKEQHIPIATVEGVGTVGEVHDKIVEALTSHSIV